jgi:hypothetical protein
VAHHAGESDAQVIEHGHESLGVRPDVNRVRSRRIAAAKAQQVEHHDAMTFRKPRHNVAPQVAGRGKSVQQHYWLAGSARAGGVVVQSGAVDVEEFAAHA